MKTSTFLLILFCFILVSPKDVFAENPPLDKFSTSLSSQNVPVDFDLSISGKDYNFSRADILSMIEETSRLDTKMDYQTEIENPDFCVYKKSLSCRLLFPYDSFAHIKKTSLRNLNEKKLKIFLQDLAQKTDLAPVNAKLQMEDGKVAVFSLNSPGVQLDIEKSEKILIDYIFQGSFTSTPLILPFKEIQPEVTPDSVNELGITSLLGEGSSDFHGSPKNRIFNIQVATQKFNGLLIKPGENFSFVTNLGEVDGEHGYLPELVIKNDKTEPEFGGGICQVSTTAFRAAINSGLEITARRNHAYPVSYYNPQGMDATVYVPKPDLSFINNTPGYILMETKIEGTKLIFDFYGTTDGRKVNVIGPKILERGSDGSMKTTFTQEVYDQNGTLIRQDVFNSNYASPSKYPHPGAEPVFSQKPSDWSKKEWDNYKIAHGM